MKKRNNSKTVPVAEICRLLAGPNYEPLTVSRVQQLVAEGMPKASRGQYEPIACLTWYCGRLRTSVQRKEGENPDGSTTSLEDERRRLIKEQADAQEMENQQRRGELMPLSMHESELSSLVITTQTRILTIPGRLAPKLEGATRGEIKALLQASLEDALSALARRDHESDSAA